ncbi:MAG: GspE/PulE family protein [Candidatus Omnitrophica bacterium]|nr:GspE/PulE family protein [Candidatus Omnitrophota bacterium]
MNDQEVIKILMKSGLLTQDEVNKAIDEGEKLKRPLERVIVDMHLLSQAALYETVAQQLGYKYVNLDKIEIEPDILKIIPEELSKQTMSIPLRVENGTLVVAMSDPGDIYAADQIQMHINMPIEINFSSPAEIEAAQKRFYSVKQKITKDLFAGLAKESGSDQAALGGGASIIKLVDLILAQAVRDRASDIHIEPEHELLRIRFRIDGILHEIPSPPKDWEGALISRIKVLSGMDIAESRIPQDGHFQAKADDKVIDFRVSTLPTIHGENVVMRLLDTASVTIGLERLGFTTFDMLRKYEELIARPYGIILSTGPTGSGKTTTLYSALMKINTVDRNIITIEDPVEYRLGLIRQVQVSPKAGITFAAGLRSMLRQDPDVIMVGEIRDLETAIIAVQAALTGHLVFSTLHTNDAPSAVTRLINMGVEPFLIAACLIGIMAQRLVRVICPNCKESYEPSKALLDKWGLKGGIPLYRGKGCDNCKGTGYRGRSGIYELLVVDDELREMILNESTSTVLLRKKAQEKGMVLLSEDGVGKALAGITTIEEVARVCEERVEIKPSPQITKIEPIIKSGAESDKPSGPVELKKTDIDEYQKRIASWLSRKTGV